jgi:NAD kinase
MRLKRATENKIILIIRRTRLDDLIARFNTLEQAKFYVEHLGADFSDYQREHATYKQAVAQAQSLLGQLGRLHVLERQFLPNFVFGERDTVVVLGQDGLLVNAAKYLNRQQIIGVNPDPARWDGVLLPFQVKDLPKIVAEVFQGRRRIQPVTMAQASLNNGQTLYAVNDLFIGQKTHLSARYQIQIGGNSEQHSSSGIIVSTGVGASGWFKSLLTGAQGIVGALLGNSTETAKTGRHKAPPLPSSPSIPWDADFLYYTVREPFPSHTSSANLVFGRISERQPLRLVSQMAENGVIFSDGIEQDFLEFNAGTQASIHIADKRGQLVV